MVWRCFSYYGVCDVLFMEGRVDENKYIKVLDDALLPWGAINHEETWTIQQHNEPIHTIQIVGKCLKQRRVELLPWPDRSTSLSLLKIFAPL